MKYDVTVIGSGPGGYIAAIRCAQLGMKTAIIERYNTLGGTCLNVGCIPSKALLDSSHHYHDAAHSFADHGINVSGLKLDFGQFIKRKDNVVEGVTKGVEFLMKKNKIDVYTGHGSFESANTIKVTPLGKGDTQTVETDKVIIATGSKPASLPGIEIDKKRVISSTEALTLKGLPKSMVIIGGGIIGVEMGSVYARLGVKVQVVEYMDRIIGTMDKDLSKELLRVLKKLGIEFYLSHKVTGVKSTTKSVTVTAEDKKGETVEFTGDYCLVSVGRKPYTDNLGLDKAGVKVDERGRVETNDHLQTNVPNIYAIGDVVKGAMLAHKAEEEGVFVAETMAGQHSHVNYLLIPSVAYTWPEVAGVGYTEQQLEEKGREYKTGKFNFRALGRATASGDVDGFVKVLADKETDEILGMHIIGARAADLIAEGVAAMEYRATAEEVGRMSHAHPTYSEATKDACLAATDNRALNA